MVIKKHVRLTSVRLISGGFLLVIIVGTLLLMLPFASRGSGSASFMDALFTATSAICVTGLVVQDTSTYWTAFGHAVILTLIQIGGMGVITMAIMVARFSGRKIGLMQRSTMQEAIAAPQVGGIVKLTNFIIKTTVIVELSGAVLMAPVFIREFGIARGIWYAVFHSISAFCNAGFDLMGVRGQYSSLTGFSGNPIINTVIMLLIVTGGIGFLCWDDIVHKGIHIKRYHLQTKMILTITPFLIFIPAVFFYFHEFEFIQGPARVWVSLFQSVTTRTAGFNTVDLRGLSSTSVFIMIILMIIGGSTGSTAGGMKNTTFFVLIISSISVFRRHDDTTCFGRRISDKIVKNASTLLMLYLVLFLTGGVTISALEGLPILDCLFETASAIGTVGLTLGITPSLGTISHLILIILMFVGRVGGLTLIFSASSAAHKSLSRYPQEQVNVG